MTHTALTADEEIRRIRGLAAAGMESRMGGGGYHDPSAHRGPAEDPTYWDVLTFVRTCPAHVMRAQAPLSMLVRRLARRLANAIIGRAFITTDSPVAKKAQSRYAKCSALVSPQRPG
jgi:hypothetical protein